MIEISEASSVGIVGHNGPAKHAAPLAGFLALTANAGARQNQVSLMDINLDRGRTPAVGTASYRCYLQGDTGTGRAKRPELPSSAKEAGYLTCRPVLFAACTCVSRSPSPQPSIRRSCCSMKYSARRSRFQRKLGYGWRAIDKARLMVLSRADRGDRGHAIALWMEKGIIDDGSQVNCSTLSKSLVDTNRVRDKRLPLCQLKWNGKLELARWQTPGPERCRVADRGG